MLQNNTKSVIKSQFYLAKTSTPYIVSLPENAIIIELEVVS